MHEATLNSDRMDLEEHALHEHFPQFQDHGRDEAADGRLAELHLYDGALCNRACSFCCVAGSPQGWQQAFSEEALLHALEIISPTGCVKFYGGEPTIHPEQVIDAAKFLRSHGFAGYFQLFTNGILAERVLAILDAVPGMVAILNYSILYGRGAEPIPQKSLERLQADGNGRIFAGHDELNDAGAAPESPNVEEAPSKGAECPHCYPVLRSDGKLHGCPFAVEILHEHFDLGEISDDPKRGIERFWQQIAWQKQHVEPMARALGITACQVCRGHLDALPSPYDGASDERA